VLLLGSVYILVLGLAILYFVYFLFVTVWLSVPVQLTALKKLDF